MTETSKEDKFYKIYTMKTVYIAGPFRANTPWEVEKNIRAAEDVLAELWSKGIPTISPHTNGRFISGVASDQVFIDGTLNIMSRCNAVVVVGSQERVEASEGTMGEIEFAKYYGIPIFFWNKTEDRIGFYQWIKG